LQLLEANRWSLKPCIKFSVSRHEEKVFVIDAVRCVTPFIKKIEL